MSDKQPTAAVIGTVIGTLCWLQPAVWVIVRGTAPDWVRWWLGVTVALWLVVTIAKAARTP